MSDTFAKVTSNDPAIVSAAVYSVLSAVGAATASYTLTDGVISVEIAKAVQPVVQAAPEAAEHLNVAPGADFTTNPPA